MFRTSSAAHAVRVPRKWLVLGFVLVALGVAGCGSSSSPNTTSSSSSAPASTTSTTTAKESVPAAKEETKNGIPQGEHAGDGDGDNHGEPSDGDGNL
jgi:hypothetical protein